MFILNDFMKQAVEEILRIVKEEAEKGNDIDSLDASILARRIINHTTDQMRSSNADDQQLNQFLLCAYVECEGDLEDSVEFEVIIEKIREGFIAGMDRSEEGRYAFEIE